ncbi:hypothetical protein KR093_008063, partial [Drosophila rubida]
SPLQRCPLDDQACLVAQVKTYFQHFGQGIPELQVPSLEPLELGLVRALNNDPRGALSFNLMLANTSLHLMSTAEPSNIKGFTRELSRPLKLSWMLSAKRLEVHAAYDIKGKLMMLPLVSTGNVLIRLNDVLVKTKVTAVPEKRADGNYYLKPIEHKSLSKVASGNFSMSSISKSNLNAALQETAVAVLNSDWDSLYADIQPRITEAYDRAIKKLLERLWNALPYDAFFDIA